MLNLDLIHTHRHMVSSWNGKCKHLVSESSVSLRLQHVHLCYHAGKGVRPWECVIARYFFSNNFHAWMFKKLFFSFTYFRLLQHLSSQSVSNALFSSCLYESPPSEKHNMFWMVCRTSVLSLGNRFECVSEMSQPLL